MKINFGCGGNPIPGYVNVDMYSDKADVNHDLNVFPYPFEDNSVDFVIMTDVFEHLDDPRKVVKEIRRILKPGSVFKFYLPHFTYSGAFNPFHKTFWSYNCVCYNSDSSDSQLIEMWEGYSLIYKKLLFTETPPKNFLKKIVYFAISWHRYLLEPLFNKYPIDLYESTFIRNFISCYKICAEIKKV